MFLVRDAPVLSLHDKAFFVLVGDVGEPFKPWRPNDPNQVALSEDLLRCKHRISQMPSESKMIALEYFEGDDRNGASLDPTSPTKTKNAAIVN